MIKIQWIFLAFLFIYSFFLFSAPIVKTQTVPNYLFLEVVDSVQKPIAGATVEVKVTNNRTLATDERGQAQSYLLGTQSDFTQSLFKVSNSGYYTFEDLGMLMKRYDRLNLKIELLKIPQTKTELKTLGDEQIKREFLWAAKTGDAETIRRSLKAGVSPNLNTNDLRHTLAPPNIPIILFAAASGDGRGETALMKAVRLANNAGSEIKRVLVKYGADPMKSV